jgi:TetR/AcrR family transcriptional repressor of nem operon
MARTKNFNKEEALNKALQLFWSKGYHATSMQDLVDQMQINRSSLYDTFGDKHRVYIEALKQYQQNNTQNLIQQFTQTKDIKATIAGVFNCIINGITTCDTKTGCFMVNTSIEMAAFDKEIDQIISENNSTVQVALHKTLTEAQSRGELSSDKDTLAISHFIMNTITGIQVSSRTSACKDYYEGVVKVALGVL